MRIPLSILDRANTRVVEGHTVPTQQLFAEVTQRAVAAEALGYHRFWVAEHHSVPGIAGSAPTVLLPHLAAATATIRLGTGGIMVPSHQPLVIAEQLATLQALLPNRLDAGLGASTGFTKPIRQALRQDADAADRFADDLDAVIAYLDGTAAITAYPPDDSTTPLYVLTGGGSARLAAEHGAGLVLGGPAVTNGLKSSAGHSEPAAQYRQHFRPAARGQRPWVMASVNIAVASIHAAAQDLVLSEAWAMTQSRSSGVFAPLESPATLRAQPQPSPQHRRRLQRVLASSIYGTPETVAQQVAAVVAYTGADELLVTGNAWDVTAQARSDALLSELLGAR